MPKVLKVADIVIEGYDPEDQLQVALVRFFFALAKAGAPCELHTQREGFRIYIFKRDMSKDSWREVENQARELGLKVWHPKAYWMGIRA